MMCMRPKLVRATSHRGMTVLQSSRRAVVRLSSGQEYAAGLAFDLETTGLDVRQCEIVQLAIVIANSQRGAKFSRLVLPEHDIDPGASAVHGLTREALVAAGAQPFGVVWNECEAWLHATLQRRHGALPRSATSRLYWR